VTLKEIDLILQAPLWAVYNSCDTSFWFYVTVSSELSKAAQSGVVNSHHSIEEESLLRDSEVISIKLSFW